MFRTASHHKDGAGPPASLHSSRRIVTPPIARIVRTEWDADNRINTEYLSEGQIRVFYLGCAGKRLDNPRLEFPQDRVMAGMRNFAQFNQGATYAVHLGDIAYPDADTPEVIKSCLMDVYGEVPVPFKLILGNHETKCHSKGPTGADDLYDARDRFFRIIDGYNRSVEANKIRCRNESDRFQYEVTTSQAGAHTDDGASAGGTDDIAKAMDQFYMPAPYWMSIGRRSSHADEVEYVELNLESSGLPIDEAQQSWLERRAAEIRAKYPHAPLKINLHHSPYLTTGDRARKVEAKKVANPLSKVNQHQNVGLTLRKCLGDDLFTRAQIFAAHEHTNSIFVNNLSGASVPVMSEAAGIAHDPDLEIEEMPSTPVASATPAAPACLPKVQCIVGGGGSWDNRGFAFSPPGTVFSHTAYGFLVSEMVGANTLFHFHDCTKLRQHQLEPPEVVYTLNIDGHGNMVDPSNVKLHAEMIGLYQEWLDLIFSALHSGKVWMLDYVIQHLSSRKEDIKHAMLPQPAQEPLSKISEQRDFTGDSIAFIRQQLSLVLMGYITQSAHPFTQFFSQIALLDTVLMLMQQRINQQADVNIVEAIEFARNHLLDQKITRYQGKNWYLNAVRNSHRQHVHRLDSTCTLEHEEEANISEFDVADDSDNEEDIATTKEQQQFQALLTQTVTDTFTPQQAPSRIERKDTIVAADLISGAPDLLELYQLSSDGVHDRLLRVLMAAIIHYEQEADGSSAVNLGFLNVENEPQALRCSALLVLLQNHSHPFSVLQALFIAINKEKNGAHQLVSIIKDAIVQNFVVIFGRDLDTKLFPKGLKDRAANLFPGNLEKQKQYLTKVYINDAFSKKIHVGSKTQQLAIPADPVAQSLLTVEGLKNVQKDPVHHCQLMKIAGLLPEEAKSITPYEVSALLSYINNVLNSRASWGDYLWRKAKKAFVSSAIVDYTASLKLCTTFANLWLGKGVVHIDNYQALITAFLSGNEQYFQQDIEAFEKIVVKYPYNNDVLINAFCYLLNKLRDRSLLESAQDSELTQMRDHFLKDNPVLTRWASMTVSSNWRFWSTASPRPEDVSLEQMASTPSPTSLASHDDSASASPL